MSKHTPGPWKSIPSVPSDGFECYWIESDDQFRNAIADVRGPQDDENEANARLIAAAPELLEAAKKIVEATGIFNMVDYPEAIHDALDDLEAAIAKATGN